jgi:hypothetical protein
LGKNKISIIILSITLVCVLSASSTIISYASFVDSPKMQIEQGVLPVFVTCKMDFELILKFNTNSSFCVTSDTAQTLLTRGWGASIDNLSLENYKNPASLPFGLFTYNLPPRNPPPLPLDAYGNSHDNPSLSTLVSIVSDPSLALIPSYAPADQERKFTMTQSNNDGEIVSLFYLPSSVDITAISTLDDVLDHNGYVILLLNNQYSPGLVDALVEEYGYHDSAEKILINNFPAFSVTGDPIKGEKSEIMFYDENEIKIDIFSIAYTPAELVKIAESLFN